VTQTTILCVSPVQAHQAISALFKDTIKPHTRKGAHGLLTWQTLNEYRHGQYRKAFHGFVLTDIAEQAWVHRDDGTRIRYTKAAWKELFRDWFLPMVPRQVPDGDGVLHTRMVKQSTEGLTDDEYALFVLQVTAFAALELGVEFEEPEDEHG
jgi:hypothetical protein